MLEIEGLEFRRGDFSLSLDLRLEKASIGVVLGRSGSGKSTLLRLIAGLERPDAGSIRLGGREIAPMPPEERRVGLVFQDYALFPHLRVRANIAYGPRLAGLPRRERLALVGRLAGILGLGSLLDRHPDGLSGGEAQRVALARSLAARPDLLLLDEPFAALDPGLRRELRGLIGAELRALGVTALHVTHDVEEALSIADRVFLVDGGSIVEEGSPVELFERPRTLIAARFLGGGAVIPLLDPVIPGGTVRTAFGNFTTADERRLCDSGCGHAFLPWDSFGVGTRAGATDGGQAGGVPSGGMKEAGIDFFHCVVESSVYAGFTRRLAVRPAGLPEGHGGNCPGESIPLAMELPASMVPRGVGRTSFAIRRGSARILET